MARRSAASASALPTTSRLGFLKEDIASFNSASTWTFLLDLKSWRLEILLLRDNGPLFLFIRSGSAFSADLTSAGSLASRLIPGKEVDVAERIRAIILPGPLETLRRDCCSVESARCNVLGGWPDAERLATEPGLGERLLEERRRALGLDGFTITGPPNLRLIESHSSGSLCEKLVKLVSLR